VVDLCKSRMDFWTVALPVQISCDFVLQVVAVGVVSGANFF
jgi:hypothetical protein